MDLCAVRLYRRLWLHFFRLIPGLPRSYRRVYLPPLRFPGAFRFAILWGAAPCNLGLQALAIRRATWRLSAVRRRPGNHLSAVGG